MTTEPTTPLAEEAIERAARAMSLLDWGVDRWPVSVDAFKHRYRELAKVALAASPPATGEGALREALTGGCEPSEMEVCGPLAWLRSAIDTLADPEVIKIAQGDDPDAYLTMVQELRDFHRNAVSALSTSGLKPES